MAAPNAMPSPLAALGLVKLHPSLPVDTAQPAPSFLTGRTMEKPAVTVSTSISRPARNERKLPCCDVELSMRQAAELLPVSSFPHYNPVDQNSKTTSKSLCHHHIGQGEGQKPEECAHAWGWGKAKMMMQCRRMGRHVTAERLRRKGKRIVHKRIRLVMRCHRPAPPDANSCRAVARAPGDEPGMSKHVHCTHSATEP